MSNSCVCIKELLTFDGNLYEFGKVYQYELLSDIYMVSVNRTEYGFIPVTYPDKFKEEYGDCIFSDYFESLSDWRDRQSAHVLDISK
jgi:hypothetical protein